MEYMERSPICADCRRRILQGECLPLGNGEYLCRECIRYRMVEVDCL